MSLDGNNSFPAPILWATPNECFWIDAKTRAPEKFSCALFGLPAINLRSFRRTEYALFPPLMTPLMVSNLGVAACLAEGGRVTVFLHVSGIPLAGTWSSLHGGV
uniref:Uncharacterized protein n=1 Tax=Timema genevievae TaxID=629358 RepID=A0A7R9JQK2_TIMGE|nr:unnamed protein product [Timema genevievae]